MKIIPKETPTKDLHQYLLGTVSPRPICFASTINEDGSNNLAPYSFYGIFGSNPSTLIFSPARRVRNNTTKHTLANVLREGEVVVNSVSYSIVQQMNVASCEYPEGVDEFVKSGLTPIPSDIVKPMRVKESPAQLECKVREVVATADTPGAGNLVICEVVCMHIDDEVLDSNLQIDPYKIDLVARMNANYYCRANGSSIFEVVKPNTELGVGVDALPEMIRNSEILTGNDLGLLANSSAIPAIPIEITLEDSHQRKLRHQKAKEALDNNDSHQAWEILSNKITKF